MGRGPIWGEGLVDDSWAQIARVDRWELVHPDETLRLFPALMTDNSTPLRLIGQLEQALAVRWSRLPVRTGGHRLALQSLDVAALTALASAHVPAWFPHPGLLRSASDFLLGAGPGLGNPGPGEEEAVLALDDLLNALRLGRAVPYNEHRALALAFDAGIHPAYVWHEALALHECATAIGWIGVVARGREALLPSDIAATLADGIGSAGATGRPRDQRFALCGLTPPQWHAIDRAARRCLAGRRQAVRLRRATRPFRSRTSERDALPGSAVHRFVPGVVMTRAKRRAS